MERFRDEVQPEELVMLQSVFDDYCADNQVTSKGQRDEAALGLITLFRRGVTDEEMLRIRLRRLLAQRS